MSEGQIFPLECKELDNAFQQIIDALDIKYGKIQIEIDINDGKYKRAEVMQRKSFIPKK